MITIGLLTLSKYEDMAKKAIDSIVCNENYRIVIVDNGQKLDEDVEGVKIIRPQKNVGIAPGWNMIVLDAIENGSEEIVILNDDLILHPECIDLLIQDIREGYDIITGYMIHNHEVFPDVKIEPRFINGMHFSCFAMNRNTLFTVGKFDEGYAPCYVEDTDYYYRLMKTDLKYGCDRWAKFTHKRFLDRQEPWVKESHKKNRAYFSKKHGEHPKKTFRIMSEGRKQA